MRSLSKHGKDPDPRFTLANERTFLAWIRTSMAVILGGVVIWAVLGREELLSKAAPVLSILIISLGSLLALWSWFRWESTERALRLGRSLPLSRILFTVAVLICGIGLGMLILGLALLVG